MQPAIDLTPRQAARVLQQALRARAELEVEPRNLPEGELLQGKLVGREGDLLWVEMRGERPGVPLSVLIGACCEVQTVLSGELYLFSTYVLDVHEDSVPGRVLLVVPEAIQVANRRQSERTNITVASQVRIWTVAQEVPALGLLANVSADGLACKLPGMELDKVLALGDRVRISFEIAGFDELFELPALLCSKSLTPETQQLSLGLKFDVRSDDPVAQHTLMRVRTALFQLTANSTDMDGDL